MTLNMGIPDSGSAHALVRYDAARLYARQAQDPQMQRWAAEIKLRAERRAGDPARLSANVDELVIAPRGAHSAKPEEVHGRIEALVAGPYLELFGRPPHRPGWTVWGNEVGGAP